MSFPIGPLIEFGLKLLPFLRWRHKRCILVVEDNPSDATYTELMVQKLGWECDVVSSAEAAYPLLISKRHSVVLLDIRLPYESGPHLAGRIKRTAPWVHVELIPSQLDDLRGIPASIHFGLTLKPVTPDSLKAIFNRPK